MLSSRIEPSCQRVSLITSARFRDLSTTRFESAVDPSSVETHNKVEQFRGTSFPRELCTNAHVVSPAYIFQSRSVHTLIRALLKNGEYLLKACRHSFWYPFVGSKSDSQARSVTLFNNNGRDSPSPFF